jgi:stage III sporulation protein AE
MQKKKWMWLFGILFCFLLLPDLSIKGLATDTMLQESQIADWTEDIDSDIQTDLEAYGITLDEPTVSFATLFSLVKENLQNEISAPLRLLLLCSAVILCSSLLHAVQQGKNAVICEMMGVMGAVSACAEEICTCFQQVKTTLARCTDFMTIFTPVFSAMMTATGQIGTAVAYQSGMLLLTNLLMQLLQRILLPFLSMSFAIAIANAVYTEHTLDGLLQLTKRITTWSLGFLMTFFIGAISMQSIVSSASDGLTMKTTKYVVSNFVPIVGSAVSDAYATVIGSLQVLKSATGAVGIAILLLIFLPVLLKVILYRLALQIALALADLFAVKQVSRFLQGAEQVLSMLFAVLTSFSILFLVTIALLLLIGKQSL